MESLWNSLRFSRKKSRSLPALFVHKKDKTQFKETQDDSKTHTLRRKSAKAKEEERNKEMGEEKEKQELAYKKNDKPVTR